MRADNSRHLIAAPQQRAEQRAEQTRRKALAAVRRLDNTGRPISFDNVAREARVSRSWLYTQADVRSEIHPGRRAQRDRTPTRSPPVDGQTWTTRAAACFGGLTAPSASGHRYRTRPAA